MHAARGKPGGFMLYGNRKKTWRNLSRQEVMGLLQAGDGVRTGWIFPLRFCYCVWQVDQYLLVAAFLPGTCFTWLSVSFPSKLFTVVIFHKVVAKPEPLHLGKYKFRFLWASGHSFLSVDQYITCFICVSVLKTHYLMICVIRVYIILYVFL